MEVLLPMQAQQKTTERNTFLEENLAKVRLRFSQETELDDERAQELITETIFDDPEAFCMPPPALQQWIPKALSTGHATNRRQQASLCNGLPACGNVFSR